MTPLQLTDHPFRPQQLIEAASILHPALDALTSDRPQVLSVQTRNPALWTWIWALCHKTGHTFMPLNPELSREQTQQILNTAGNALLLDLDDKGQLTVLQHSTGSNIDADIRLIIHTSGSSGQPRGVMHKQTGIEAAAQAANQHLAFSQKDLWLLCLSPWHIGGIAIMERARLAQAQVAVTEQFDPRLVWQQLQQHPVTHISLVPAMLARLLSISKQQAPPTTLRCALIGGGPLSRQLYQQAHAQGWPLCISYGLSEAGSQVATLCNPPDDWQPGDVGPLLDGIELKVGANSGNFGPIMLRGPMIMAGYLNAERRLGVGLDNNGWFTSSDLGRLTPGGELQILGRGDDMIISAGINIHPALIEQTLEAHPDVQEVAVLGTPDPTYGAVVTAIIVGDIDPAELDAWCRKQFPSAQRPRRIIPVDELPLLSNGKIDKQTLQQMASQT